MWYYIRMYKFLFLIIIFWVISCTSVMAETPSCLDLQSDLKRGVTNNSVMLLQKYLHESGYLKLTPSGYFGEATFLAVKKLQASSSISSTGYVGQATRLLIKQKTCNVIQSTIPASSTVTSTTSSTQSINVTFPSTGQVLPIGNTITIRWNKAPSGIFNIILEQPGGAGAGFVANNLTGSAQGQYTWKVGNIFSTFSNLEQTVPAGTYRLRLQNANSSSAHDDIVSGWFTIVAPSFSVSDVRPASSLADNSTAIVLFGSGFSQNNNSVYFDSSTNGIRARNLFVSSDGTVFVFAIPVNVSKGPHTLIINNSSSGSNASIPFVVTGAQ